MPVIRQTHRPSSISSWSVNNLSKQSLFSVFSTNQGFGNHFCPSMYGKVIENDSKFWFKLFQKTFWENNTRTTHTKCKSWFDEIFFVLSESLKGYILDDDFHFILLLKPTLERQWTEVFSDRVCSKKIRGDQLGHGCRRQFSCTSRYHLEFIHYNRWFPSSNLTRIMVNNESESCKRLLLRWILIIVNIM